MLILKINFKKLKNIYYFNSFQKNNNLKNNSYNNLIQYFYIKTVDT